MSVREWMACLLVLLAVAFFTFKIVKFAMGAADDRVNQLLQDKENKSWVHRMSMTCMLCQDERGTHTCMSCRHKLQGLISKECNEGES